jgi:predicted enzyme related to lactoylglutathione lyase
MTSSNNTAPILELAAITVDCVDAHRSASFWSAVTSRAIEPDASPAYASITGNGEWPTLSFEAVPERKVAKNRLHVDLRSADPPATVTRLRELGATIIGTYDEGGAAWTTLADPDGNEFCVM